MWGVERSVWPSSSCGVANGSYACEARNASWAKPHLTFEPTKAYGGVPRLCVFLPGTGSAPSDYSRLLYAAADSGLYVIGLSYLTAPIPVAKNNAWCSSFDVAADCNEALHAAMLFGDRNGGGPTDDEGRDALWPVEPDDSVSTLVSNVLRSVPWGEQFIRRNGSIGIDWSRVVISGHSQGAGHAAYLSYINEVDAVLFSGPQDCSECADQWLKRMADEVAEPQLGTIAAAGHDMRPTRRPRTRLALFHEHEECGPDPIDPASYCEANLMVENLELMGLLNGSAPATWNSSLPVPATFEAVMSNEPPLPSCQGASRPYHESVAMDACAPPSYDGLWRALFEAGSN